MTTRQNRIAIVGGGLIGTSWAAVFAHHGAAVTVWDPATTEHESIRQRIANAAAQLTQITTPSTHGSVTICEQLFAAVVDADLIQENAPENVELKHELYREIEGHIGGNAIVASSTSALRWSDLAPGFEDSSRLITAHPFNPPHLIPLVEMYGVDPVVLDRAESIYRAAEREPVRLKQDAVGHIANRLSSALYREAVSMVAEGIADVAAVDAALVHGPGRRWSVTGAHLAYHLGGGQAGLAGYLEHLGPSQERRWAELGEPALDEPTKEQLIAGIDAAVGDRTISELESERDAALIEVARLLRG